MRSFARVLVSSLASRERSAEAPVDVAGLESVIPSFAALKARIPRTSRQRFGLGSVIWYSTFPAVRSQYLLFCVGWLLKMRRA
jgi:hypothetical protein